MIKRLRRRLIATTMLAVILVFVGIMSMVNLVNHYSKEQESDVLLATLVESGGAFRKPKPSPTPTATPTPEPTPEPSPEPTEADEPADTWAQLQEYWSQEKGNGKGPNGGPHGEKIPRWAWDAYWAAQAETSPTPTPTPTPEPTPTPTPTPEPPRLFYQEPTVETPYETRYFSVQFGPSGALSSVDTSKIAAVSTSQAVDMAKELRAQEAVSGYYGNYKYLAAEEDGGTLYVFLDCTKNIQAERQLLGISVLVSVGGILVVFLFVVLLSPRMIRPVAESYEKQKLFITNASHEIKTPLAVIDSCADVIELEQGESKWTEGIRSQVQRLGVLTSELTALARLDEQKVAVSVEEFDLSEQTEAVLEPFRLLAESQGLMLETQVQAELFYTGNAQLLSELCTILLDNAVKYTTPGGTIRFSLQRKGRKTVLRCENPAQGLEQGSQKQLFDRFYRGDASRGGAQKGYGIGLSMAEAIVEAHHGKIQADSPDGTQFVITAVL